MLDTTRHSTAPFDTALLDRLMDQAGLDVLIATSKHNVQYLLGGHRSFFFDNMDAIGISRYLPAFVYPKGQPEKAAYFGHGMESYQRELKPFWVSEVNTKSGGSIDVMQKAADYVASELRRIGMENVEVIATKGHPLIYADWLHASGKPTVLCYAHYDVQPAEPAAPARTAVLDTAHVFFTGVINVLYGQKLKDPFTMFKVFRRDCLYGLQFECNRFDFDHELVIKLVLKGYQPLEIPVNYCSRSFKQGKKIRFFRDPPTWIAADLKYRLRAPRPRFD